MSNAFRAGIDNVIREAELEELEKEWRERNARIMAEYPEQTADTDAQAASAAALGSPPPAHPPSTEAASPPQAGPPAEGPR